MQKLFSEALYKTKTEASDANSALANKMQNIVEVAVASIAQKVDDLTAEVAMAKEDISSLVARVAALEAGQSEEG